jgi:two-component system sensor histidine kinase UhpB
VPHPAEGERSHLGAVSIDSDGPGFYTRNQPFSRCALTIPAYTPPASPDLVGPVTVAQPSDTHWWRLPLDRLSRRFRADSWFIEPALDVAAVVFIVLPFTHPALSAEFIFHCLFVVLVLHAFLFGGRGTFVRIGLASIPILVYAYAKSFGLEEPELELTEWPLMFVIAALVAWMAARRNSTSKRYASLFRRASERLLTVEEDERRRIAGELHDGVGQVLTALSLTLDAAGAETDPAIVRRRIASARSMADTAMAETRDLSHRLRPARLEERGLVAALRDLAAQSGFPIVVHAGQAAGDKDLMSPTAMTQVYRIVQEALANAAHHSGAQHAEVRITRRKQRLTVVVSDDGIGFDPEAIPESGIGLAGMLERSRLAGGELSIQSAPLAGTQITISLPIDPITVPG